MTDAPFQIIPKEISLEYRKTSEYYPNYPESMLDDFYFNTKTYFDLNEKDVEIEIFSEKFIERIFCEVKNLKSNIVLLTENQISKLNLMENQMNSLNFSISNLKFKNVSCLVIKTRFPRLLLSIDVFNRKLSEDYSKYPFLRILSNDKEIFKFPFDVKFGFTIKNDQIFIPFECKDVIIQLSPLIFEILNFQNDKQTCYILSKNVQFLKQKELNFKSITTKMISLEDLFLIQISKK